MGDKVTIFRAVAKMTILMAARGQVLKVY